MGSVDRYGNIGIEYEWVVDYFESKDDFWSVSSLGNNKIKNMKSFLSDCDIIVARKNTITPFGELIASIGIETPDAWGLIATNLAYTAEFNWWIKNTSIGMTYTPAELTTKLEADVSSTASRSHIVSAFKNIYVSNPYLGKEFGLGICTLKENAKNRVLIDISRSSWLNPIPEVILYSLYKFAEGCEGLYEFSLEDLLNDSIERDGVSPTRIFGLDHETMVKLLNGLTINYPEFIYASFTLDLDNITLRQDKTSQDVLKLFRKENDDG